MPWHFFLSASHHNAKVLIKCLRRMQFQIHPYGQNYDQSPPILLSKPISYSAHVN